MKLTGWRSASAILHSSQLVRWPFLHATRVAGHGSLQLCRAISGTWDADVWASTNRVNTDLARAAGASPSVLREVDEWQQGAAQNAIQSREQQRRSLSRTIFRIAGVTFENRQELLQQLEPEQALMLVREPTNPFDPCAISVQTLDGASCGYVPRDLTHLLQYDETFCHVYSMGRVQSDGPWGARVVVQTGLPPLTLTAFPTRLAPFANLKALLPPTHWDDLTREACRRAHFRCQVSGLEGQALVCRGAWYLDDEQAVMRLTGLQVLCEELDDAKHILEEKDEKRRQRSFWMLQAMNEWTAQETSQYLRYITKLAEERSQKPWRLDMSYLGPVASNLPANVLDACV